jgi:GTP cyclohydrolase I|tara:strand:+ start:682 stop:1245 length:564 start_codon:yes stop_codon:yes gene_type:complete
MEGFDSTAQIMENPLEYNIVEFLELISDDPDREGLKNTPLRVAKLWTEFMSPEPFELTTFENYEYDQMIISKGIKFHSFCEHHLIPFFGTCGIGYIPDEKLVGLSKLARTVDKFSRRLNTQEYMTQDIADFLWTNLKPIGLGVIVKGRHLCQEMRGIKKEGQMITSTLKGVMLDKPEAKSEFMKLVL